MNLEQIERHVDKVLQGAGLPSYVESWDLRADTDSTGDPAVYVWLIVRDEEAKSPAFPQHARELREIVFRLISEATPERWPYVTFRSRSDRDAGVDDSV